jgi:GNAT superfamily N-acetyltransferase
MAMALEYQTSLPGKAACFELFQSTGWNAGYQITEDQYFEAVRNSWHIVAAYDGEQLIGLGRVLSDGMVHALIVDMMVLPPYQGRGVGGEIMRRLLERCEARRIRDVQLFAAKGKAGFYKRLGFVERPADAPGMGLHPAAQAWIDRPAEGSDQGAKDAANRPDRSREP